MALIAVEELTVKGRLNHVSFELKAGEVLGVIGPNGSGKTTLMHSLAGIESYQGEVLFKEQSIGSISANKRARQIGFMPQQAQCIWALKVEDVIALGRLPWGDENKHIIDHAAHTTGVNEWLGRSLDQLSGGEKARVWLARVLAGQPALLLADEPLASLDLFYQCHVMNVLKNYAKQQHAVIVSVHDLSMAARYCDRLLLLDKGRVFADGTPNEVLTFDNISTVYHVNTIVDMQASPPVITLLGVGET